MYDVEGQPYRKDPFGPSYARSSFEAALGGTLKGKRAAFVPALCGLAPEADVLARVSAAADAFRAAGAEVVEVDDPLGFSHADIERIWYGLYYVFSADTAEGLKAIGFDVQSPSRTLLSETFLELVDKGMSMTALEFQRLNHERTKVLDAVDAVFDTYDYLLTPTNLVAGIPNAPEKGKSFGPSIINGKAVSRTMGWSLTYLFNLTGHPIASVPVGLTDEGHPVGMQVVGPRHADLSVLSASADFERHMPWAETYQALK
jgi:amidase/aspartyl-tRNA(Asn)/glutamyl-tRNA(Gln) amidotransferase subunit A